MALVWVTGNSGTGKSTVCGLLKDRGQRAVDADWEGFNQWVDRATGQVVTDPPDPVSPGWLDAFGWQISHPKVEALAGASGGQATAADPHHERLRQAAGGIGRRAGPEPGHGGAPTGGSARSFSTAPDRWPRSPRRSSPPDTKFPSSGDKRLKPGFPL